ncbi:MAG: hypothetical protein IAG13_25440 [Deltaproteobacteria bacterium]|nr:hypothetical protein [Nannocystaceae bacterium]
MLLTSACLRHSKHTGIATAGACTRSVLASKSCVRPIAGALQHTQVAPNFGTTNVNSPPTPPRSATLPNDSVSPSWTRCRTPEQS